MKFYLVNHAFAYGGRQIFKDTYVQLDDDVAELFINDTFTEFVNGKAQNISYIEEVKLTEQEKENLRKEGRLVLDPVRSKAPSKPVKQAKEDKAPKAPAAPVAQVEPKVTNTAPQTPAAPATNPQTTTPPAA